jgi:hypothetical protein
MSTTRQNTDYGYDIQKVYLEMMLSDAESFVRCQAVFDPGSFDRRLKTAAEFLGNYLNTTLCPHVIWLMQPQSYMATIKCVTQVT